MANEKSDAADEKPKKSSRSSSSRSSSKKSSGRSTSGRGRGGRRQSARAAEPEVLESASKEEEVEIAADAAEEAPETGASARDEAEGTEAKEDAVEETPAAPAPQEISDGGISPFAREFFLSRGILTRPTPRDQEEDLGEEINHDLPERPKRNTPPSLMKSGRDWLSSLFVAMQVNVEPKSRYDKTDKTLYFELSGDDAQSLLGANGASPRVLESMEKVLQQFLGLEGTDYQVHIDVDNFRERRGARLRELAGQLADLSKSLDKAITIAGMNEFERRVVHRALSDAKDIDTDSHGYGTFRKIRIQPD